MEFPKLLGGKTFHLPEKSIREMEKQNCSPAKL